MNEIEELKISEMIEAESVSEQDLITIVQNGVNKKIKFSKFSTGGVEIVDNLESDDHRSALSAKQGKILNEKMQRHIITANIITTTVTGGTQTTLSVQELCKSGNKLSIESGRIKIGAGVSKVLVYAKVLMDTAELTNNFLYVIQNNTIINRADGYGKYETLSTPGFLVNVQEGDKFTISVLAGTNASVYDGSYITVEVIE